MKRKFPAYTTAQLIEAAKEGQTGLRTVEMVKAIKQEISDRTSGASTIRNTPVVPW